MKKPSHLKRELSYCLPRSRPKKILFDHLPKCGGSTLNAYLAAHYPERKIFSTDGLTPLVSVGAFKALPKRKRHGYALVRGHHTHMLLDEVDPDCLVVTVLREPVDRIISHYFYAKRTPDHYLYAHIHRDGLSLKEYATSGLSGELRNWYTSHFSGFSAEEVDASPELSLTKAYEALESRYHIIGFLDHFSAFIETLQARANLQYDYRESKANVTKDRPRLEDIPEDTIQAIRDVNALDLRLFEEIKNGIGCKND